MGYRDDLYCADNIIGYTGKLNSRPTVYFFGAEKSAYGHITQDHPDPKNIGREEYNEDPGYRIENTGINAYNYPVGEIASHGGMPQKGEACVEWATDPKTQTVASFHTSRNLIIPVRDSRFFNGADEQKVALAVCAVAIREYQTLKPMYA